jgi:hypothetical protein
MPLKGEFGSLQIFSTGWMPSETLLSLDASLAIPTCVLRFEASRRLGRPTWAIEPAWVAAPSRRVFGFGLVANRVTLWFSGETLRTP